MRTSLAFACLGVVCVVGFALADEGTVITYESLLREMVDRDVIARFPDPAYRCLQASSYDRESDAGLESDKWFANADRGQYIREETNAGRQEWVLMDVEGPGAVVRFWSANPSNDCTIRFYFDGNDEPALPVPFTDLLGGTWRVGAPLSAIRSKGWNLYLPIPFAKGCKITSDKNDFYYQINYRLYQPGTQVETFSMDVFDRGRPVLRDVVQTFRDVGRATARRPGQVLRKGGSLAPGHPVAIQLPDGPRVVRRLTIRLNSDDPEQACRQTVVRASFDAQETTWCPVGDFYGSGVGINRFQSWWQTVERDGTLTCYWPMPYREIATISLERTGRRSRGSTIDTCEIEVEVGDWDWDDRSMYFHATWRHTYPLSTETKHDWNYVEIKGKGVYVGDCLALMNPTTVWWGEGDEKIYVDSETFPSHFGTGTEDYYGYAWGDWHFFQAPFHAQPRCDGPIVLGHTTVMRSRSLDAIPFTKSLKFDIEVWHWRNVEMAYAATTWFYAQPGATHNRLADRDGDQCFVAEVEPMYKIDRAREGEDMELVSVPDDISWKLEGNWWDTQWSGDAQIWFGCERVGDAVELRHPEPVRPGQRKVTLYASRYSDYGIIHVSVDGQLLGEPIDLYNPEKGVAATGPIELGTVETKSSHPVVRIEVVGSNPMATKPGTYFGFDCIVFGQAGR